MLKLIGRTLNDFYVLVMIIFLLFDFLSIPYVFAVLEFLSPRRQDGWLGLSLMSQLNN